MKNGMTGAGSLPRKIATILALSAMTVPGASWATDATGPNSVYIQQLGSTNTVKIEQTGGTNRVGGILNTAEPSVDVNGITTFTPQAPGSLNYATINGSNTSVDIKQNGNANSAQYSIQAGTGINNSYTSTVTGDGNKTRLKIGDTNNQNNGGNTVTETITGNTNLILTNIVGNTNTLTTTLGGNSNQATYNVNTTLGSISNTVSGNYNVFDVQQTDSAGASGHSLTMNTTGSYNSITTQQQGTNDTTVNINTNGSNNTITVRTSSSSIIGAKTAIAR